MGRKLGIRLRWKDWRMVLAIASTVIFIACSQIIESEPTVITQPKTATTELNIWWEQGFNHDEDRAILNLVNNWQTQTANQVKLSFYNSDDLTAKAKRAIQAGKPPDILMSPRASRILYPRLAWQGKLEDVTDIIEPVKADYPAHILQGITYYNAEQAKDSYYGVPLYQSTMFIYYWQKLLADIGLKAEDIPQDWQGFWQFWQQAQIKLNTEKNRDIYGLGLPLSDSKSADDTHYLFEQILEAYDINLFDSQGKLNINSQVRQSLIDCLTWYAQFYRQGSIPPTAVNWLNTDNNRNLLNEQVLMTPNNTLSIPATVRQDPDTYYNQLGITEFPNKPSGEPMCYLIFIRQAVIFKNSLHKSLAKNFLRYFIQPQVTLEYLKNSGCRNQPVQKSICSNLAQQNPQDPYITTAITILTTGKTRLSPTVKHPAYSQVLAENLWGKALTQVTANQVNPEQAADEAIARIQTIFEQWQQQSNSL